MTNPICWLIRRRLGAYRDGELGPAAHGKTRTHLGRCPACAAELAALDRLRTTLAVAAPEPSAATWDVFWPQVRARLATSPQPERAARRAWTPLVEHPRLAFASAVAVAGLALFAVLAPWQSLLLPEPPRLSGPVAPPESSKAPTPVVVQSVETEAPNSSVMVYTHSEAEVTVVWVFGLEPTEI
jgi:anti-sigma factor RsiW